jgi:hypothetical protein
MTLLLFVVGVAGMSLVSPCGAGDVAQDALAAAAAGCPKCTCACSPWAGAWVGGFTSGGLAPDGCTPCEKSVIETFKLAPISLTCDHFVLNLQVSMCEPKVLKAFPEATDMTEFVGVACKDGENKVVFTAIGYGMKKSGTCNEVVFIGVKSGTICMPSFSGDPNAADVTEMTSIFAAEQDADSDGLPDTCDSVMCISQMGVINRIVNRPPCEPAKTFLAILEACRNCQTHASGKAFFKRVDNKDEVSFVITVKNITDPTRVVIHVASRSGDIGEEAVILCPIPPATECRSGNFSGVLCCGTIMAKHCIGPLKDKEIAELIKAINEGRVFVVISTKANPRGELCGQVQDP